MRLRGRDQIGVLTGHAYGERPVHVDGRDDVAVDLAHEHHARDVERVGVGDPQAIAELGLLAGRAMRSPIWGPPPCTTTGSMPTARMRTTSCAKEANGSAPSSPSEACSALPPYLTTTIFPQKRRM